MSAQTTFSRPLSTLLSSQLRTLPSTSTSRSSTVLLHHRHASTAAREPTLAEKQRADQQRQMRMMEKAGRAKANIGQMTAQMPAFANYVRPRDLSKRIPEGTPMGKYLSYGLADAKDFATSFMARNQIKKYLGKGWDEELKIRAGETFIQINEALASGQYAQLSPLASSVFVDSIKSQRSEGLHKLHLSWKLHKLDKVEFACVRSQELMKKGEIFGQVTVRFVSTQSLEIRTAQGKLVSGNHEAPNQVTEYYCFHRDLWKGAEQWRVIKKLPEILDPLNHPDIQI
ncbi:hypothetical protein T439DRAFT_328723 [Meredithblackwellia eburnea MCA 4105]